jgi:hypothetical protein
VDHVHIRIPGARASFQYEREIVCPAWIHHHYSANIVASIIPADNSGVRGCCLETVAALEANVALSFALEGLGMGRNAVQVLTTCSKGTV